jgi:hypothetical protein
VIDHRSKKYPVKAPIVTKAEIKAAHNNTLAMENWGA